MYPLRDCLQKAGRIVMIYDIRCTELQNILVLAVKCLGGGGVDFRVLDDVGFAVLENYEANRLSCIAFADNLGSEVYVLGGREPDEDRVGNLDETVVDTVGVDVVDVAGFDIGKDGGGNEGLVDAAIAIGGNSDSRFGLEDDLAFVGDAWEYTLLEKNDVLRLEAEVVVLLEEFLSGAAGRTRGHDVPGHHCFLLSDLFSSELLDSDDSLSLELEEGLFGGKANVEAALGSGGA